MSDSAISVRARRLAAPSWLNGRLVLGVLLVLISVLVGARVLSAADRTQTVWTAARDLAPGSVVDADDLARTRVRLFDSGARYLAADGPPPSGYLLRRGVSAGELLPVEALVAAGRDVQVRLVTVAVQRGHLPPDLAGDQRVDVHMTPDPRRADAPRGVNPPPSTSGAADIAIGPARTARTRTRTSGQHPLPIIAPPAPVRAAATGPRLVLPQVTVVRRAAAEALGAGQQSEPVVLSVRPDQVAPLLLAVSQGTIDLVRVPQADEAEARLTPARQDS